MKKIILLLSLAIFTTACNSKASVNHGVIKVEHEPATAEEMHHKSEAMHEGGHHSEHGVTEKDKKPKVPTSDSINVEVDKHKTDTIKAGH